MGERGAFGLTAHLESYLRFFPPDLGLCVPQRVKSGASRKGIHPSIATRICHRSTLEQYEERAKTSTEPYRNPFCFRTDRVFGHYPVKRLAVSGVSPSKCAPFFRPTRHVLQHTEDSSAPTKLSMRRHLVELVIQESSPASEINGLVGLSANFKYRHGEIRRVWRQLNRLHSSGFQDLQKFRSEQGSRSWIKYLLPIRKPSAASLRLRATWLIQSPLPSLVTPAI